MNYPNKEKISVVGHTAIYHAWKLVQEERRVDFSSHVNLITKIMGGLVVNDKPKFIAVVGASGCGASGLAEVLANDGVNVKLINVVSRCDGTGPASISHLISDTSTTYIIDGLGFATEETSGVITSHINRGGVILVFMQYRRDMVLSVEPTWLKLDRTGLAVA